MPLRMLKKPGAIARTPIPTFGKPGAPILLVLDPLIGPKTARVPISTKHFKYLGRFLKEAGITKDQIALLGACPPVSEQMWKRDKDLGEHLKKHRDDLLAAITKAKPKIVVAMGKCAARQLAGRAVQITKVRGVPYRDEALKLPVLPTLGVLHVARQPENEDVWRADIASVARIVKAGYSLKYTEKTPTKYRWCTDLKFLLDAPPEELSVDTETLGVRPYDSRSRVLTVQLSWKDGESIAVPIDYAPFDDDGHPYTEATAGAWTPNRRVNPLLRKKLIGQLKRLLENRKVKCIGHNLKFDWQMLYHRLGIRIANYADDTLLLAHAIDENMLSKSLDDCVRRFVPAMSGYSDAFDRDPVHLQKSRMDLVPPHKMLGYGAADADACRRLHGILKTTLQRDKRAFNCYRRVAMPAMRAFADLEETGFHIDTKALEAFGDMLREHQHREAARLTRMVPDSIRQKFEALHKFKLTNPAFLVDMLFQHKDGLRLKPIVFTDSTKDLPDKSKRVPSVSTKQHLPYFDGYPFVDGIKDLIKNDKLLNTYVGREYDEATKGPTGFWQYIENGTIRPSYLLHGTVTGRSSSKNPNGQNFPKRGKLAKQYRKIFSAPPGYVLIEADFSQIELRVAAIMANEPEMLRLYREGADIHSATAAYIMGLSLAEFNKLPDETRDLKRFQAKAVNFGFLYGMGWKKFRAYAKTDYGIDFTEEEAQQIRSAFFKLYKRLPRWHEEVREFAAHHGYVRAIDGRVRHLTSVFSEDEGIMHGALRQAINAPVQGFAGGLGLMAIARIHQEVPKDFVQVIGFIHDALVCLAPVGRAIEAARTVKHYMETNPLEEWFGFKSPIPILADVSLGYNLSAMAELKGAVRDTNLVSLADYVATLKDADERAKFVRPLRRVQPRRLAIRPLRRAA